ncbi:Hypothetical protein, putative [Bodo saltans]|uniref:Uncharacterized protein n=1 Tax=Bodo saltans TaxID=75058 RepID=A0A0S4JQM8_BODSA|nr:Hypothetical protein, putative [Bodo saltans]|eukprot:CUG93801.1 Hypothetical protein, putative [Bodo saltans]
MSSSSPPKQLSPRMSRGIRRDGRDSSIIPIDLQPLRSSSHPDVIIDRPFWLEVVSVFQTLTSSSPSTSPLSKGSPHKLLDLPPPSASSPLRYGGGGGGGDDALNGSMSGASVSASSVVMLGTAPLTRENVTSYETTTQLHGHLFHKYMVLVGLAPPVVAASSTSPGGTATLQPNEGADSSCVTAAAPSNPMMEQQTSSPQSSTTAAPLPLIALLHRTEVDGSTLHQILTMVGADCALATVSALMKIIRYSTLDVRALIRERSNSPSATTGTAAALATDSKLSGHSPHRTTTDGSPGGGSSPTMLPQQRIDTSVPPDVKQLRLSESQVTKLLNAVATVISRRLVALRLFLHRGGNYDRHRNDDDATGVASPQQHRLGEQSSGIGNTRSNAPAVGGGSSAAMMNVVEDVLAETSASLHALQRQRSDSAGAGIATIGSFSCRSSVVGGSSPLHRRGGGQPSPHQNFLSRAVSPPASSHQSISSRVRQGGGGARSPPPSTHGGGASSSVMSLSLTRPLTPTRASLLRASPSVRTPPTDVNGRVRRAVSPSASELLGVVHGIQRSPGASSTSKAAPTNLVRTESPLSRRAASPAHSSSSAVVRRASSPSVTASASAGLGYSVDHHQRHVAKAFGHIGSRIDCLHMSAVVHGESENPFLHQPAAHAISPTIIASLPGSGRRDSSVVYSAGVQRKDVAQTLSAAHTTTLRGQQSGVVTQSQRATGAVRSTTPTRTSSPTFHHHGVLGGRTSNSTSSSPSTLSPLRGAGGGASVPPPPPKHPVAASGRGGGVLRNLATEFSSARLM